MWLKIQVLHISVAQNMTACSSKINKSMMLAFPLKISRQLKQAIAILMSWVAILLIILVLTSNMWANFCLFQQR
jgi:hypothetical protein